MQTLTKKIVQDVGTHLIESNGSTTTLDVKQELRNQGYWAVQHEISTFMSQLADDGVFKYTDNGTYRTYNFVCGPTQKLLNVMGKKQKVPTGSYQCSLGQYTRIYDHVTRNQAKYKFAKEYYPMFDYPDSTRSQCKAVYTQCKAIKSI